MSDHVYGWEVLDVTSHAAAPQVVYLAKGTDPDGQLVTRRVVLPNPPGPLQVSGLRLRASRTMEPDNSAWLAVADHLDAHLAEAAPQRREERA